MLSKLVLVPLVCAPLAIPQGNAVPSKETLYYNLEWRLITAGKAKVEWTALPQPRAGWQVNFHLESVGMVSKLFKVEDDYSALLNQSLCAESAQMTTHEGSRQRETKIAYDAESKKASYQERDRIRNTTVLSKEIDIPACVHDVIGGLYFLRNLNLEPGQSTMAPVSDGKKSVMAKVEALPREDVKTPAGTFKTVPYELYLFNHVLWDRSGHLTIWLSDDRRRLPVQIRVRLQFTIGTILLQLTKYE
ncbi:conserved exported hypothetical protein [Candidatus Sulfopaludibacter sp. SbA4]|nr:conserved exported hypothetical protein [Candidatus Sulfopaludibacter sp. SbA4]